MNRLLSAVPFILLLPTVALAQASAPAAPPQTKDRQAVTFDEIERGFFFGVGGGWSFIMNPPADDGGEQPFSSGTMARVEMGMDFGDHLSLAVFLMGTANRAGAEYVGKSGGRSSGDFSALIPGATVRANFLGIQDGQEVRRTWLYLRGSAGFVKWAPKTLLPDSDILLSAGPGVEYFTRLRHFSIALEVVGNYLLSSGSTGFAITPNIRYAF